jgi:hypothetical protein
MQAQMNSKPTSTPQSRSEHPSGSTEIASASFAAVEASTQKGPAGLHYSALAQMVAEVCQDHAHLRSFIYEFARIKLRKELYPRFLEGAWSEIEDQMRGLENAIDEIEAEFAQSAPVLPFKSQAASHNNSSNPNPRLSAVASRHAQGTTRFGEGGIHARSLLAPSNAHESSPRPIAFAPRYSFECRSWQVPAFAIRPRGANVGRSRTGSGDLCSIRCKDRSQQRGRSLVG